MPFRRSVKLRMCSSILKKPVRIPAFTASTAGGHGAGISPPELSDPASELCVPPSPKLLSVIPGV
uniref:Uncharacterized protein n=1 Tax=Oryzias latipes TaxID=8090 RepID=A0A3P9KT90_ORYLA